MPPLLIIPIALAIYLLVSKGGFGISLGGITGTVPPNAGVEYGAMPQGNSGPNTTDNQVSTGFAITAGATSAIPVVGQITAFASKIASAFTAAHAAAMKREAATLNHANPNFISAVQQAVQGYNEGAISAAQAVAYLQQAQDDYYTTVKTIIKKSCQCAIVPNTTNSNGPYNIQSPPKCACGGTCNAACCVGCLVVEASVKNLVAIIQSGKGGQYAIATTQNNGAIVGTPEIYITITPPAPIVNTIAHAVDAAVFGSSATKATSTASVGGVSATGAMGMWVLVGVLVFLVLAFTGKRQ